MAKRKRQKMDKLVLFLIPIGVAINFVCGQIAAALSLPFYLDTIGTIVIGALCGALPGVLVGLVSNLINAISFPVILCFAPISIIIGILAAVLSKRGFFKKIWKLILVVIIFGVIGGGLTAVINWIVYGFDFGIGPSSYISVPMYKILHLPKFICEIVGSAGVDICDKAISIVIMAGIFKAIPQRMLAKLPLGEHYMKVYTDIDDDDDF